jgi:DNA invertase Pin-like site-specific DNA recombinase
MVYGYARVSTNKQSIERQIRNILHDYPDAKIYQEAYTGTTINRKEWNKLYKQVQAGDTIVFDSVSRMSRDATEGYETYQSLYNEGVNLVFIKEPHINTEVFKGAMERAVPMTGTTVDYILEGINRYLMELAREQIKIAFEQAAKEVEDLHQRTKEGIETARRAGKQIGQRQGATLTTKKSIAAKEVIRKHLKDFGGTLDNEEVQQLAGISRNSFFKYKREIVEEMNQQ